jgi:uncharacterized membrane protein YbhN (UPF0104 family)
VSGSGLADRANRLLRRGAAFADRVSARTESKRGRQITMVVSAVVFVGAMALGFGALPEGEHHLQWWAIVLTSVVGVPVLIALNAVEYIASGRVLGHRIAVREAMPIAIYARAANLLPIPGAALVRMQALKREGSTYGRAASATMATALVWLGASLLVGGVFLVPFHWVLAVAFLAGGIVVCLAAHAGVKAIVARRPDEPHPRAALQASALLLGVEVVMVTIRGLRFWLVMIGFDIGGSFAGAMVLPVAGVVASAIGFFPSGLGVREVISGGLSRLVGDTASSGLLASGLDRIVTLPVMAVLALGLAVTGKKLPDTPETEAIEAALET